VRNVDPAQAQRPAGFQAVCIVANSNAKTGRGTVSLQTMDGRIIAKSGRTGEEESRIPRILCDLQVHAIEAPGLLVF
jgi:hypothetical protein